MAEARGFPRKTLMKILRLTGQNFKKVRAVDITPDPDQNVILIGGKNDQGKTSVLDMIQAGLDFASMQKRTPQPIREGAEHAEVELDMSEIEVKRTFTDNDTNYLTVRLKDNARTKVASPQAFLDKLMCRLSFDPLKFLHMESKDQRATLFQLDTELEKRLEALETEYTTVFAERTDLNRTLKQEQGALTKMTAPAADLPEREISSADLLKTIQNAQDARLANATQRQQLATLRTEAKTAKQELERTDREIIDLEVKLTQLRQTRQTKQQEYSTLLEHGTKLAAGVTTLTDPDLAEFQKQLTTIEQRNDAIRSGQKYRTQQTEVAALQQKSTTQTTRLAEIDATKASALQHARFPIPGLGFSEDGVTLNGKPFQQASSSQQLRASLAIAMALNPEIQVIRIGDGSLLDSESMDIVRSMATEKGFQVWIEVVSDNVGIIIEDGTVQGAPALPEPALKVVSTQQARAAAAPGEAEPTPARRPPAGRPAPAPPTRSGLNAVAPMPPRQTPVTTVPAPVPAAAAQVIPLRRPMFAKRSGSQAQAERKQAYPTSGEDGCPEHIPASPAHPQISGEHLPDRLPHPGVPAPSHKVHRRGSEALALAPGEIFSAHESEYQVSGCSRTLQK